MFFRIGVNSFGSKEYQNKSGSESNATYIEFQAYEGNPFTQFLGQTGIEMKGSKALKVKGDFNNFGFVGDDFFYYKPSNVIRVACLGESTTADGYPKFLEKYLNENSNLGQYHFEVYNFGHGYWTTNHSVANFALNVIDFSPDFVVIHHGWNEDKIRNFPAGEFRGDYSHRFKVFNPPFVPDRYVIRVSAIYRYFKFMYDKSPAWMSLGGSIDKVTYKSPGDYRNYRELVPYQRNLNSIVNMALANNIKVVFATIPVSTDSNIASVDSRPNIIQCNAITRTVSEKYKNSISLVDLDAELTGKRNDIFVDLAHINDEGRVLKAKFIGNAILMGCDSLFLQNRVSSDKGFDENDGVRYFIARMKNDSNWYNNDLKVKAKSSNLPIDSVMVSDARFLLATDTLNNRNK